MKVILTAAVTLLLLIGAMPAMADTSTTTFEDFGLGTVNGQDGWKVGGGGAVYDQQVVTPGLVGLRALRMSNAVTSGSFEDQTFSKPVADPAGENVANKGYTGEFTFLSTTPDAQQQGLAMSISPDNAHGARMSYVRLEDRADGIRVFFSDTPNQYAAAFDEQWIATLDRSVPHTIRFEIKFVKGNANDIVRVYVDNELAVCGTTWENYYRFTEQDPAKAPEYVQPIDRMEFRLSGTAVTALAGKGFLFDNVTTTTTESGGPKGCPLPTTAAGATGATGPSGVNAVAGPPGPAGQTIVTGQSAVGPKLIGNTRRVVHVPQRTGERFLSARATLRNKRLPVRGRSITVDLRGKVVGNYNVFIVAKYRTMSGKVHVHSTHRSLSVTRALLDAHMPA